MVILKTNLLICKNSCRINTKWELNTKSYLVPTENALNVQKYAERARICIFVLKSKNMFIIGFIY